MSNHPLVSIIIPCYNAAKWIREAIDSCLAQTYESIEIIVIDDGSTDESVQIISTYGSQISLHAEKDNRGGNYARNQGISYSRGHFLQFLDADDYLQPDKIAHQVAFLQENHADVVYGDWQHQFHTENGDSYMGEVQIPGHQDDVLISLLNGWWTSPASILFSRSAVIDSKGWDESLTAGQDRDFFISVAMTGADIRYQPGCHSVYRRYGAVTVSTSNTVRWLENHERLLDKAWHKLNRQGKLGTKHRQALAISYFHLARNYYREADRSKQMQLYKTALKLDPRIQPQESFLYTLAYQMFGFSSAEKLAYLLQRIRGNRE